jgi:hypothetical protein
MQLASLVTFTAGGCDGGEGGGESKLALVLDAACMHLASHYVSLSRISILL